MTSTLAATMGGFLGALLAAAGPLALGALLERWRPARAAVASSLAFNLLYFAPASFLQALLAPAASGLTVLAVNALGGGLIALPAQGWGLAFGLAAYLVVMDLGEYLFHRAQHALPWMWAMHSLHHSDEAFNASTTVRHFWLDVIIKTLTIYLAAGFLLRADPRIVGLYGLLATWNYVAHMNVPLGFGRWAWALNTPLYHRRHHSSRAEDRDCNFAALLPIWDVLTGAYRPLAPGDVPPTGLGDEAGPASVLAALAWPLRPGRRLSSGAAGQPRAI